MLGLVARRGETIPGDGLGEAIPTLGPRGESHVRLARLASTRLVLISASSIQANNLAYLEISVSLAIAAAFPSKCALQQAVNENSILHHFEVVQTSRTTQSGARPMVVHGVCMAHGSKSQSSGRLEPSKTNTLATD